MPTKILVVETPNFQLGTAAGETEKITPEEFPTRLQKTKAEFQANKADAKPIFVIAPEEIRLKILSLESGAGPMPVSLLFFVNPDDAAMFMSYLPIFADESRAQGVKDCLAPGATIYTETFFNSNSIGSRLDPCFLFARSHLSFAAATNVMGSLQTLVFLGLNHLPAQGEKSTGEKVDVQIGADEKILSFTVRFPLRQDLLRNLRNSPLLALPRMYSEVLETRYLEAAGKIEISCIFFRKSAGAHIVDITSFHLDAALEKPSTVKEYSFKTFINLNEEVPKTSLPPAGTGFKKKFSEKMKIISGGNTAATAVANNILPAAEPAAPAVIGESEARLPEEEHSANKREGAFRPLEDMSEPGSKRDVLTNIKEAQNEGLKQTIKALEGELESAKAREKDLIKMVDKAVQTRDEAIKKNKELEHKHKQAASGGGSKVQILEKQIEEQKRQNKELSKRVTELMERLKAA